MPELPDVTLYVEALASRVVGHELQKLRVADPFVLRTFDPPTGALSGLRVLSVRRLGKRVVIGFEGDVFAVIHLMIAGRLRWKEKGAPVPKKVGLLAFDFDDGTLVLTEASKKRRASLHLVRGEESLRAFDRGGVEVLECDFDAFDEAITRESRTLKRAMTDPRLVSGVGNAYSDEILFHANLSPARLTRQLDTGEKRRLFESTHHVLTGWVSRLRAELAGAFPDKVTPFHEGMAVHGRFRKPCLVCGTEVQRVVYAANEMNYCPRCQTGGKLLADRSLSRLLKGDWPRTMEELESMRDK